MLAVTNKKILFYLFLCIFLLNSCATLLNNVNQKIVIETESPSKILYRGNEFKPNKDSTKFTAQVLRSPVEIELDVIHHDTNDVVTLYPQNSLAFWSNILFNFGIGLIVDNNNIKRYGYSLHNYIDYSNGQAEIYPYKPLTRYLTKRNTLRYSPSYMFSEYKPGIEIGYERRLDPSIGLQTSILAIHNQFGLKSSSNKGVGISFETRYYFNPKNPTQLYASAELGYNQQYFSTDWNFFIPDTAVRSVNVPFEVASKEFYFAPKAGIQLILAETLVLDFFVGIGVQNRAIKNINLPDKYQFNYHHDDNFVISRIKEGNYTLVKGILNFRIGFSF